MKKLVHFSLLLTIFSSGCCPKRFVGSTPERIRIDSFFYIDPVTLEQKVEITKLKVIKVDTVIIY